MKLTSKALKSVKAKSDVVTDAVKHVWGKLQLVRWLCMTYPSTVFLKEIEKCHSINECVLRANLRGTYVF